MDYTLNANEDFKDFIHRTLQGKIDQDKLQMFIFLMEMIVTEMGSSAYSVTLHVDDDEVDVSIVHQGRAIKKNIIDIIDDQVDHLHYRHQTKDSHILKLRKKVNLK